MKRNLFWVCESYSRYMGEKPTCWTGKNMFLESDQEFWTEDIHKDLKKETKGEIEGLIEDWGINGEAQEHEIIDKEENK